MKKQRKERPRCSRCSKKMYFNIFKNEWYCSSCLKWKRVVDMDHGTVLEAKGKKLSYSIAYSKMYARKFDIDVHGLEDHKLDHIRTKFKQNGDNFLLREAKAECERLERYYG